jgi:hypothetical protein
VSVRAAIDFWATRHTPTALTLRILAESAAQSSWMESAALAHIKEPKAEHFYSYPEFKGLTDKRSPEYRWLSASSPLTTLGEVMALRRMFSAGVTPLKCVHSYLPSTGGGRIFARFSEPFAERIEGICAAARSNAGLVEIFTGDVQAFYPSIDRTKMESKYEEVLRTSDLSPMDESLCRSVFSSVLLHAAPKGVPIGPPTGHFLANLYLASIDRRMEIIPGLAYTRYVDDVSLVGRRRDVESAGAILRRNLDRIGLRLNAGKTGVVSSTEWLEYCPEASRSFLQMQRAVRRVDNVIALAEYAGVGNKLLRVALQDAGVSFRELPTPVSVAQYLRNYVNTVRMLNSRGLLDSRVQPEEALTWLSQALFMLRKEGERLCRQLGSAQAIMRRHVVRGIRYVLARSLVLGGLEAVTPMAERLGTVPELADRLAVVRAFQMKTVLPMLSYSGPAVRLFLWAATRRSDLSERVSLNGVSASGLRGIVGGSQVIVNVALAGLVDRQASLDLISAAYPEYRVSLPDIMLAEPLRRRLLDHSYLDEVESIRLGWRGMSLTDLFRKIPRLGDDDDY